MRCLCENCYKYKFWFEMISSFSQSVVENISCFRQFTCKKCAEKLHAETDMKIREALCNN